MQPELFVIRASTGMAQQYRLQLVPFRGDSREPLFEVHGGGNLLLVRHDPRTGEGSLLRRDPLGFSEPELRRWSELPMVCQVEGDWFICNRPTMARLSERVQLLAPSPLSVLLLGETGVGKEVWARRLHQASGRPGNFVAVNCAALPRELVQSELFGHAQGAFSGAKQPRQGLFRAAHQGTLLLDEIGDLPLDQQGVLLRVLEDKAVRPVGSDRCTPVDVRIVAATCVDLRHRVEAGLFRADLFARLAEAPLVVPPLRERPAEILPLLEQLSHSEGCALSVSASAVGPLLNYRWPLNVRELRSLVRLHRALAPGQPLSAAFLRESKPELFESAAVGSGRSLSELDSAKRPRSERAEAVRAALVATRGNVVEAAQQLGVSRATLYRELRRHSISVKSYRGGVGRPSPAMPEVASDSEVPKSSRVADASRSGTHFLRPELADLPAGGERH